MPKGEARFHIIDDAWDSCNQALYYEKAKRADESHKAHLARSKSRFQKLLDACRRTGQSDDGPNLEVERLKLRGRQKNIVVLQSRVTCV